MAGRLAIVVPHAAGSPWIGPLRASLDGWPVITVTDGDGDVGVTPDAGFAEWANAGVAEAERRGFGRVLLLNDDTEPVGDALEVLASSEGVIGATLRDWDGPTIQQAGIDVDRRTGRIRARTAAPSSDFETVDAVSGGAMAFPVATWRRLGGFDEGYRFYFEDVDFCLRAGEVRVARDAVVRHRGGGTRSHRSPEAAYHLGRSHTRFARSLGGRQRLPIVIAAGMVWTVKSVGVRGLPAFLRGVATPTRPPARAAPSDPPAPR